ncbi:MAG: DUF1415 domain-containing protein [Sulfuriflexus sp.]|nr:DUF1415 domain-containing protein [Sulfuriflexus sp.]
MVHKKNPSSENIITNTRYWVKSTVIHYNLCPFASQVFAGDKVGFEVSAATTEEQLLEDCLLAIQQMLATPREELETSLLIHPHVMNDFSDYNDFLGMIDVLLEETELAGIMQVASFHPDYCFADSDVDDAANFTNRSPYPMLHLLREESISEAIEEWTERSLDVEQIPVRNIETLRKLGADILADQLQACYREESE